MKRRGNLDGKTIVETMDKNSIKKNEIDIDSLSGGLNNEPSGGIFEKSLDKYMKENPDQRIYMINTDTDAIINAIKSYFSINDEYFVRFYLSSELCLEPKHYSPYSKHVEIQGQQTDSMEVHMYGFISGMNISVYSNEDDYDYEENEVDTYYLSPSDSEIETIINNVGGSVISKEGYLQQFEDLICV